MFIQYLAEGFLSEFVLLRSHKEANILGLFCHKSLEKTDLGLNIISHI